jgi:hypothetical protein
MGARRQGNLFVWAISAAVALVVVAGAILLVRPPPRQELPKARLGGGLGVQRLENDKLLAEQAELRDPLSLFLPTRQATLAAGLQSETTEIDLGLALTRPFPGKLAFADESAAVEFPLRTPVPSRPVDAIGLGDPEMPFLGMGRIDRAVSALPVRSAFIEVTAAETGKIILSEPIRDVKVPSASDWQPLEMVALVDRIGLVAPPTISRSSTSDSVDDFFRSYLQKGLHLGERLGPGSYVVTVGR